MANVLEKISELFTAMSTFEKEIDEKIRNTTNEDELTKLQQKVTSIYEKIDEELDVIVKWQKHNEAFTDAKFAVQKMKMRQK